MLGNQTIRLQGVGIVLAIPASNLEVGMRTLWNYGYSEDVLAITPKGPKTIVAEMKSVGAGYRGNRTMRTSSLVAAYWPPK